MINSTVRRRTNYDIDEIDDWNLDELDQDWLNHRLPWSKRVNSYHHSSTYNRNNNTNSYRTIRQPINYQQRQFYQTQFVKPEPTRKATIPFLQPAFAPNASTQYPRDQPLPRLKPGTVRTRGYFIFFLNKNL